MAEKHHEHPDSVRRRLLKASLAAGGLLAGGHIPYAKPAAKSFFGVRSAWAQPTGVTTAQFTGNMPDLGGGLGTGQDEWQLDTTQTNTTLTISVTITSGTASEEIGLFAPGVLSTGTNLITGVPGGYSGGFPVVITVAAVGTYTIAISDSLANFLEVPYSYQIDILADKPFFPGAQTVDDGTESLLSTTPIR